MFTLTDNPLVLPDLQLDARAGGVVTFSGHVRDLNNGKLVTAIDYEAYPQLAEAEGNVILEEARAEFGLQAARAIHRVGHLKVGERAVWVYAAAMHRREAFLAAEYIIHAIKHRVPIWKKEYYADGSTEWVRCGHTH